MVEMTNGPTSPYQQLRRIEFAVQGCRPGYEAGQAAHKAFDSLLRQVQLAQQIVRDYELSEDSAKTQLRILPRAVKSLEKVRTALLKASEYELVGAVDAAQLSAQLDEMAERLR